MIYDFTLGGYVTISDAIILHDNVRCDLCKGAGSQQDEHYALGKLRFKIGKELEYTRDQTRQLDLATLLERWHTHEEAKNAQAKATPRPKHG